MTVHSANPHGVDESNSKSRIFDRVVQHGGRDFYATQDMAAIFTARADGVMARHDTELVPLLHRDGVELLLIAPTTLFIVSNISGNGIAQA